MTEILNFTTIEEKKQVLEVWDTKNFIKFWENCKKVKIELTGPKKVIFLNVFR